MCRPVAPGAVSLDGFGRPEPVPGHRPPTPAASLPVGPAGSLSQALRLAKLEPLSAAIVDFNLRGDSSTPVVRVLKKRGVPVVLATAYSDGSLPKDMVALPRLEKPFVPKDVLSALTKILSRSKACESHPG